MASDTKYLATIGKELWMNCVNRVKQELSEAIESPIRKKCKAFVESKLHQGIGTKARILELFNELAHDAVDAAQKPAKKVLLKQLSERRERNLRNVW